MHMLIPQMKHGSVVLKNICRQSASASVLFASMGCWPNTMASSTVLHARCLVSLGLGHCA